MKNSAKKESILKKLWSTTRGKAILKLGGWIFFFLILGISCLFFQNPNPSKNLTHSVEKNEDRFIFTDLKTMLTNLKSMNYQYHFQIIDPNTEEKITYFGEKNNKIDIGYRESKLGIIKYKIIEEKTFQLLNEVEEEINNLYLEEDLNAISLDNLIEKIDTMNKNETINDKTRILTFQNEIEIITIKTNEKNISSIQIKNNTKEYILTYQVKYNEE